MKKAKEELEDKTEISQKIVHTHTLRQRIRKQERKYLKNYRASPEGLKSSMKKRKQKTEKKKSSLK